MKFVRAIWKLLVGIKDALVLIVMLIFFGALYSALSARPAPVRNGVLDLNINGSVVEQPSRASWSDIASGNRLGRISPSRPRSSAGQSEQTTAE